jgi:glycosyltransferase involved in cell wall biosynthesis
VIVSFIVSSIPRPLGGNTVCYELANGLARRGRDAHLVHVGPVTGLHELAWFRFEPGVQHTFLPAGRIDVSSLPDADFIVNPGHAGDDPSARPRTGLPLNFMQGHGAIPSEAQAARWDRPWPKMLIATWLIAIAREMGVPDHQMVYVPPGIDHHKYRVLTPIGERPMQVAMLYNQHPAKGPKFGIDVIAEVKRRIPELRAALFGIFEMQHALPPGADYLLDPPQEVLVEQVYNGSRAFICSSVQEGFGLCSVEAMACGGALVTSATRGSDDFATHEVTALVSAPKDVESMANNLELLLRDDARRIALAERGVTAAAKFDWDVSAEILEAYLERYGRDPARFRSQAP